MEQNDHEYADNSPFRNCAYFKQVSALINYINNILGSFYRSVIFIIGVTRSCVNGHLENLGRDVTSIFGDKYCLCVSPAWFVV